MSALRRVAAASAAVLIALGGAALGAAVGRSGALPRASAQPARPVLTRNRYVCPMHPQIVDDHPGRCPICGMDLTGGGSDSHEGESVQVDAAALSALGVVAVSARQETLAEPLRTYGTVTADESRLYTVDTKFDGWLRKLNVHSVGERVRQGQVLYEIYSPDLVAKQREYFRFLTRRKQVLQAVGDVSQQENEFVMDMLRESQKEREELMRQDLGIDTIRRLEDTGTTIEVVQVLAQRGGVVTQLNAREGAFVTPAQPIAVIADPASLWIDIALAAGDLERVSPGDPVAVIGTGGDAIRARIDFVSPVSENGRGHARAVIARGDDRLRLGGLVDVTIELRPHPALVLPASAVARTGHGDFVMLDRGQGRFLPIGVKLGIESPDGVEVASGLQPGAQVASNAQFLLDAAASIEDERDRRQPPTGGARAF
jgi:Cu(I)/Ag(I) efflux system membrane fusion protein